VKCCQNNHFIKRRNTSKKQPKRYVRGNIRLSIGKYRTLSEETERRNTIGNKPLP